MKIGILGSSGGSAFSAFHDLLTNVYPQKHSFVVVTDRTCGLETVCDDRKIPHIRTEGHDNAMISDTAFEYLNSHGGVDIIILYFLRLVTPVVYMRYPTFNIHPSLLPAFAGFHPVQRAFEAGVKFLGSTLHQVDASVDNGPIISQMVMPVSPLDTWETLEKNSYLQKVYLALLLVDLIERETLHIADGRAILSKKYPFSDRSCPALSDGPLLKRFYDLQRQEGAEVIR